MRVGLASVLFAALLWGASAAAQLTEVDRDLQNAARAGDLGRAQEAVARGASPNATDWNDLTAFQLACRSGNLRLVEYLYRKGANPNLDGVEFLQERSWYGSPLASAAGEGHLEVVRFLVETCGLDPDKPERPIYQGRPPGWTPLTWAAQNGQVALFCPNEVRGPGPDIQDLVIPRPGVPRGSFGALCADGVSHRLAGQSVQRPVVATLAEAVHEGLEGSEVRRHPRVPRLLRSALTL